MNSYSPLTGCVLALGLGLSRLYGADLAAAREALDREDFKQAVRIAERVAAADPKDAEAWIVLGHGLSSQIDQAGLLAKADLARRSLAAYMTAATLDPRNLEAHVSLLEYYRQAPSVVGGNRAKAIEQAKVLVGLDAGSGDSWLVRLALEDARPGDAFKACEDLLHAEPDSYRALYWLGESCAATGMQLSRGAAAFRRARQMVPGPDDPGLDEADACLGRILEQTGDRAGAILAYEAALAINPKHAEARARLAKLP